MTEDSRLIPAGSQTVGPFFRIGLDYLIDRAPALDADIAGRIEIRGRVLDRDGIPVPDAVLEFWTPRSRVRQHQAKIHTLPGSGARQQTSTATLRWRL